MLDTVGVIFGKLGHAIMPYSTTILHLITCLLASYDRLLDQREQVCIKCEGCILHFCIFIGAVDLYDTAAILV